MGPQVSNRICRICKAVRLQVLENRNSDRICPDLQHRNCKSNPQPVVALENRIQYRIFLLLLHRNCISNLVQQEQ